jgi:coenzyme Q-binding protein COQ10
MPAFATKHPVAYSAQQMFDLVADVEAYPQFLPMCTALSVTSRTDSNDGGQDLIARMSVGYKSISESFTTRVEIRPGPRIINASYIDGPFRYLGNRWSFHEADSGGSIVDFAIRYEFKSALLGVMMGGLFDQAFRRFTGAFEDRARVVYGAPPSSPAPHSIA